MNLARLFTDTAASRPEQVAVRLGEHHVTYGSLAEASERVAGLLVAHGVGPGDRVAIMLPNVPEFASLYYGVLRTGAVVVPMNPLLKAREVRYLLSDSGARLVFAWPTAAEEVAGGLERAGDTTTMIVVERDSFAELLATQERVDDVVDREAGDTAVILYTSGTTGQPKGAELTHGNLTSNVEVTQSDLLRLTPQDVVFGGLPLFHSFGQTCTLNATMAAGATLLLLARFDPGAAAGLLATYGATVFAGVPTMYSALLALPARPQLPALRACVSGGAALPVEVLHRFEETFGCEVLEGYGLSETSPVASFNRSGGDRRLGSIGYAVSGVELRVVDESGRSLPVGEVGEIAIRGHNVMKGYWGKPRETAAALDADGWFRTGDMGRVDTDGFYYVVDRKKDVIIRGGFNVYPREVEEVLYEHPDVAAAAVIGIPHQEYGEEVAAAVALTPGARVTEAELRDFVRDQVAAYKYPRHVWFVDALPLGPTGKILKREIVAPVSSEP
ncbi:long-chain fatty acid--CoA ligase [Nocardioides guangzhouensis]|uniref:Long-chain fatty acid--CoA ligase n=1 Tax=Nocardioides guangzhouensis TaxID=2497878 RepID=A0A4Q4ZAT2_9ACTN|nr:long-chain fatty acid--CoA ligase [Nocardioides guangzhouensis]RYP85080.1 long-chain fatty acid--CoA ligase [Nocardioides guangzhouensis]